MVPSINFIPSELPDIRKITHKVHYYAKISDAREVKWH